MKEWKEYYKKSISDKPSKVLEEFFKRGLGNTMQKRAIDLGCGVGNDTTYLLKKDYYVTAVDKEKDIIEIIKNRLSDTSKLEFVIDKFENIKLNKSDLVISNFSMSFCNPKYFQRFCDEIIKNININGYFVGNFFRKRR